MTSLKVIASAYACEPDKGSEPGIGWNIVRELARRHEMWVITRANNRTVIEQALDKEPVPNLRFLYYDLPRWAGWWKRGTRGLQLYYYLWQLGAYRTANHYHQYQDFDVAHHVTFGRYWNPSFLYRLPIPFVWGPVGGGESTPPPFFADFDWRGQTYELLRDGARWLGEHDPFVRMTARRAHTAFATTRQTADRLARLGTRSVKLLGNAALNDQETEHLASLASPPAKPIRFVSIGRMLHWKGYQLALRALARTDVQDVEYWLIGDGPEAAALQQLVHTLGLDQEVTFWGNLPREATFQKLAQCHALLHPSLHDSGGWACIEAMAAGRPVICLDLGGPALMVTDDSGFKVPARSVPQTIAGLADAITTFAEDADLRRSMSDRARKLTAERFTWSARVRQIEHAYLDAAAG